MALTIQALAVSACSTALLSVNSDRHPYGEASLVVNEAEGFESLVVVGIPPDLSCIGRRRMNPSRVTGGKPLGGTATILPKGVVTIYPTPSEFSSGPYRLAVLIGNLADCR